MLKPGDKIQVSRNGEVRYIDTVLKIDERRIAFTKNGQRFAANAQVLRPLRGLKDYGYKYDLIKEKQ